MKHHSAQTNRYHRWDLVGCATKGHATYKPTGSLKAKTLARQLHTCSEQGDAWRCLRCGNYVLGAPSIEASLTHAPIVPRGKAIRASMILRVLAVERIVRGLLLALLVIGILKFRSSQDGLQNLLQADLPALQTFAKAIGYNLSDSATLRTIEHILSFGKGTLFWAAIAAGIYSALQLIEGIGLWLMKRWGEYFSAIATSVFLPLEIIELSKHVSVFKVLTLTLNLAAVAYLVHSKRLFGLRGGSAAYEADLYSDNLLTIAESAKK